MITITDASAFSNLQFVQNNTQVIPTQSQITSLIGSSVFVNSIITTAFKNLLIDISNTCLNVNSTSNVIKNAASSMFILIGFSKNNAGIISFNVAPNALDLGTKSIINSVNDLTSFREKAYAAFHGNNWNKTANDIRDLSGSNLKKIHHITVYDNSNVTLNQSLESETNILNIKDESTGRFVKIKLNNNNDPVMPRIRIYNNSDLIVQFRVKVEFLNYVRSSYNSSTQTFSAATPMGGFGPAIAYDTNNNGTIQTNERIFLNRKFYNFFPNLANNQHTVGTDIYTRAIGPQQHWDVNYDTRIIGGEATIEFIAGQANSSAWNVTNLMYFKFQIRAVNPTYSQVRNFLNTNNYLTRFWFMIRKIRQETGSYGIFNSLAENNNNYEFIHFNRLRTGSNYSVRKNNKDGLPNFGAPRGFGLAQIDNYGDATAAQVPTPPAVGETMVVSINNQNKTVDFARKIVISDVNVWNWKSNLVEAVNFIISEKIPFVVSTISAMRNTIVAWNNTHPNNKVVVPPPINYSTIQFAWVPSEIDEFEPYNNLFQEGTAPTTPVSGNRTVRSFYDAILLKTYNGNSGGGTFMELTTVGGKPTLIFNPINNLGFNYVELVSNRND